MKPIDGGGQIEPGEAGTRTGRDFTKKQVLLKRIRQGGIGMITRTISVIASRDDEGHLSLWDGSGEALVLLYGGETAKFILGGTYHGIEAGESKTLRITTIIEEEKA